MKGKQRKVIDPNDGLGDKCNKIGDSVVLGGEVFQDVSKLVVYEEEVVRNLAMVLANAALNSSRLVGYMFEGGMVRSNEIILVATHRMLLN